jgi:hypothetical protein
MIPPLPEKISPERPLTGHGFFEPSAVATLDTMSGEGIIYHPLKRITSFEPRA